MAYASASFDPALVATNSDAASSALAEANAASGVAASASDAASNALSKITAKSATWDKASAASSVAHAASSIIAAQSSVWEERTRVAVNDADRINTALTTDFIIAFTALSAARAYQISSEDIAQAGRRFIIKDESGAARTYNITISTEGAETIDGADTVVISNAYGAITLYSNGSNLFIY